MTRKNFPPGWWTEKIAFPPLNYDQKVEFWPFLAGCVQHCSHSRASALVQWASLVSSDPFNVGGSTWKSLWGPGGTIQDTCYNYGKIHSYAAAILFYPPKKNFRVL